jgi:alkylation response protein AidB-like acyl-CoA dehydrogenase
VANVFSSRTLGKFEDASAGIPLRPLSRAFDAVGIRLGEDPGGVAGSRKVQFRRYIASIDQRDPQQLHRLGEALGALIDEVAESKQEFLVKAAESDGFRFADGVFRPAAIAPRPLPDLASRARAMVPALREQALETERRRAVAAETLAMFRDADFFRILAPARFGGLELDFATMMDVVSEVGRGCGSSAWLCGLGIIHRWLLALFPLQAQVDVCGDDPDGIITGSYAPQGVAQPVKGGYRIPAGKWSFSSGIDHSRWSVIGVMFPPAKNETAPTRGLLLVPATDYQIEDDWFASGLTGTGSKTIVIDDMFVPEHRKLTFPQAVSGGAPGTLVNENPLYRVSFMAGMPCALAAPAFGIVQGAIEDAIASLTRQLTRGAAGGAGNRVSEFAAVQTRMAEATAALDAARLLLYRDCDELLATVRRGDTVSVDMRIRNRRNHAFAIRLAVQAVDALNETSGGRGLYLDNTVQRAWRDVHAISKHIALNWDSVSVMTGQHLLGLEPRGTY